VKLYQKIVYDFFFEKMIPSNLMHSKDFVHLPSNSVVVKKSLPAIDFQKLNTGISDDSL
jgi:hypothetical protein